MYDGSGKNLCPEKPFSLPKKALKIVESELAEITLLMFENRCQGRKQQSHPWHNVQLAGDIWQWRSLSQQPSYQVGFRAGNRDHPTLVQGVIVGLDQDLFICSYREAALDLVEWLFYPIWTTHQIGVSRGKCNGFDLLGRRALVLNLSHLLHEAVALFGQLEQWQVNAVGSKFNL